MRRETIGVVIVFAFLGAGMGLLTAAYMHGIVVRVSICMAVGVLSIGGIPVWLYRPKWAAFAVGHLVALAVLITWWM